MKRDLVKFSRIRRNYNNNVKNKLIDFLGGRCKICGIDDRDVLVFDHKYNDGYIDRTKWGVVRQRNFYLRNLKITKKRIQLLCSNCNLKKEIINLEFQRLERNNQVAI